MPNDQAQATDPVTAPPDMAHGLPMDAQGILELAARSMFHLFSSISQGMFLVDRSGRIVWVNEGYKRFLPALGFSSVDQFVGHMVEDVIPNTQMRRISIFAGDFTFGVISSPLDSSMSSRWPCPTNTQPCAFSLAGTGTAGYTPKSLINIGKAIRHGYRNGQVV